MPSISKCIKAVGGILDRLPPDVPQKEHYQAQYQKILKRNRDSKLYLATIGDFSSGKSTLINTLIGRKLLKVAHRATTAVSTYIYRGKDNQVAVKAVCQGNKKYDLSKETDVKRFEKKFDVALPGEIDEMISLLTVDPQLSAQVQEIRVELPGDELTNGLCIVDTPGINPGADYAVNHQAITKKILEETADAAIILFPADQAYTKTFEEFLKENAEYFMRDAIFVVTMLDRVDPEEREDVIAFVKTNLRNNFHLTDPQVLSCSAMMSQMDSEWAENFAAFERVLMERLAQNRRRIITRRLATLSKELLTAIQAEVSTRQKGLQKRLRVLQNHSVPQLVGVLGESQDSAEGALIDIGRLHNAAVKYQCSCLQRKIMQNVNDGLNVCRTRSEVTKYVKENLTADIEAACRDTYNASVEYTKQLNDTFDKAVCEMVEQLKVYYGEIGSALPENTTVTESAQGIDIADKLADLSGMIGNYEGKLDLVTAISGAGLAALVLTSLGPIGWLVGGVAALIGGDRLFVDTARNKIRVAVSERVPDIAESIERSLCDGMQANYQTIISTLSAKKRELIEQYQPTYESLERQLVREKQALAKNIQNSEELQNNISVILQELNQIQGGATE